MTATRFSHHNFRPCRRTRRLFKRSYQDRRRMRITSIVARYLLGLMFTVFGLNGFLNFIHQPPPANPLAMQFFVAVSASHFAAFFFAAQVLGGLLLLSGYWVPLALTVL